MYRIDNPTASTTLQTPAPPGTPGYWTGGDPASGESATIVDADWLNALQEEISYAIEQAGIVLSKTDRTQLAQALRRMTRIRLTAPLDLYCSPTGSDSNSGLSAGAALRNPQAAYNLLMNYYDTGGQPVTVHLADGAYSNLVAQGRPPGLAGSISFVGGTAGSPTSPSAAVINGTNRPAVSASFGAALQLVNFRITATGTGSDYVPEGDGIVAVNGASLGFNNLDFGPCDGGHMRASSGYISSGGQPYRISGGAAAHFYCGGGGIITTADTHVTLTNNPAFSSGFALFQMVGLGSMWNMVFTGAATGPRYNLASGSIVNLSGASPTTYFPGSVAGTVTTAAQFV
jgi:hypothetical protein